MARIAIVANGTIEEDATMAKILKEYDQVIAADGGLHHCDRLGVRPALIVGDMDSTTPELLEKYPDVPLDRHPIEKDQTDLELAIEKVSPNDQIGLFGTLGRRADFTLMSYHLLFRDPKRITIETETERSFAIVKNIELQTEINQMISLIPLGAISGITTKGLKWELNDANFNHFYMSISNVCLKSQISISLKSGGLICSLARK